jgi:hypothetical protein
MIRLRRLLVLVMLAALAGCAFSTQSGSPPSRSSQPPRTRCGNNPNEIILFCAETP